MLKAASIHATGYHLATHASYAPADGAVYLWLLEVAKQRMYNSIKIRPVYILISVLFLLCHFII